MLYPRIIPSLLIHNKGLVKTTQFKNPKYVGDPLNAVKIFNEKFVDELIVTDIDASVNQSEPDYAMIEKLAMECRMPLCYGGGIKNIYQAKKIFSLGVEKIAISSIAINNPDIIIELSELVGSQSIIVVLDVKKKFLSSKYEIYINNGKEKTGKELISFAKLAESLGAGEIVVNSIDKDGMMEGYDYNLVKNIRNSINLPLTVLGGAGSLHDIGKLISDYSIIGAGVGSLFVFKGKYKAVLINYPNNKEKIDLINTYLKY